MRWLLTMVLFLGSVLGVSADTFVYVSMAPEQKIQVYRLDPKDGKLTPVEATSVGAEPGSLAVDPQKKFLFASLRSNSSLASFRLDQATGKMTHINSVTLPNGANSAYVTTDRSGRWLLSTSYRGGNATVHRLDEKGTIESPAVQTVKTAFTAHSIVTDRENRWVFVPTVMSNVVFQFRFDPATGKLEDAGKAPGGADKVGPRHLAFHPTLNMAYTSDEKGSSITAYAFDATTGLKPVQTVSSLPADFKKDNFPADVKVHPNGKYVWITNRGHDSLAGFTIDAGSGKLTPIGQTPTEKNPRSIDIEPDGRFLLSAGEDSGKLAVFGVNLDTGKLTRLQTYDVGKSLTWVMAVKFIARPEK
jgi:6-phosphogluconolactonase